MKVGGNASSGSARHPSPTAAGRYEVIDFWRGFVLCTIFVNHVPGNVLERLTFRNFGFSDSSEAFVFISGLSLALAYERRLRAGEHGAMVTGLARRAVKLYAVHIGLSLAGLAVFAAGAALTDNPDLMQAHGRDLLVDDPRAALLGLVSLGHQFGYFNILPLYVLLVGMAPVLLLLARISLPGMLAASFALYAVARVTELNIPSWPMQGAWFFDPFAWQFLMAIGLAVGLRLRHGLRLDRRLAAAAAALLAVAAFCATDGFGVWPGLADALRGPLDLDKTMLGLGRLVHFLALAGCLPLLMPATLLRRGMWFRPLCLLGRNGLFVFALLSVLAAMGQVATQTFGHSVTLDAVVIGGGLALLYAGARLASRFSLDFGQAAATVAAER